MGSGADANKCCANEKQVGGDHYKVDGFQHWDMVALYDLNYFEGQITKYVMRCRKKEDMLKDLRKAHHFIEKYIELVETGVIVDPTKKNKAPVTLAPWHDQYSLNCGYPNTNCVCSNVKGE